MRLYIKTHSHIILENSCKKFLTKDKNDTAPSKPTAYHKKNNQVKINCVETFRIHHVSIENIVWIVAAIDQNNDITNKLLLG